MNLSARNKSYETPYAMCKDGEQGEYRDEAKTMFALKALQTKGDYLTYEHDCSTRREGKMPCEPKRQIAVGTEQRLGLECHLV